MKLRESGSPHQFEVEVTATGGRSAQIRINGEDIIAALGTISAETTIVRIGRRALRMFAVRQRNSILVAAGPAQFEFVPVEARVTRRMHGLVTPELTAPMPGKVVKVLVAEGQQVDAGEALVVLEAMKMETALRAESAAVVKKVRASVGQVVDHGAILLELSPAAPASPSESGPQDR
jgi:acetyl/propionyl-CoA carboxylase alpha subunit